MEGMNRFHICTREISGNFCNMLKTCFPLFSIEPKTPFGSGLYNNNITPMPQRLL
ncbi:hypothetical protein OROGR_023982 [Orobanche gracilis]